MAINTATMLIQLLGNEEATLQSSHWPDQPISIQNTQAGRYAEEPGHQMNTR